MAICLSQNGTTMYLSKSPSNELLVTTAGGVLAVERKNTKEWHISRKSLEGRHIGSLMIEPSSGLTFAGVHKGTVYASGDLGRTWERRDKGLPQEHVFCLNSTRVEGKVKLYAGTEPAHLFESDDLGEK